MIENEKYVYHLVTRKKMQLGQIIRFHNNEKNTLYKFFFEKVVDGKIEVVEIIEDYLL